MSSPEADIPIVHSNYDFERMIEEAMLKAGEEPTSKKSPSKNEMTTGKKSSRREADPKKAELLAKRKKYDPRAAALQKKKETISPEKTRTREKSLGMGQEMSKVSFVNCEVSRIINDEEISNVTTTLVVPPRPFLKRKSTAVAVK